MSDRPVTVSCWVPSWGDACGISEYAAFLAEAAGSARVVPTADPWSVEGADVIDIQYEDALFDDAEVLRVVREAKRRGVPVVVTEHSVWTHAPHSWEPEVAALVCLSPICHDRLTERVPGVEVTRIHHGVLPFMEPRPRQGAGATIALFGLFAPHKRFGAVLDAAAGIDGAEILMLSHGTPESAEHEWRARSPDVPVTRVPGFLPVAKVRETLASRADVVVFWYEAMDAGSVSGAARTAISTGVPVLTSRTPWFAELASAAYQPDDLRSGLRDLLSDESLRRRVLDGARRICDERGWPAIAEDYRRIWSRALDRVRAGRPTGSG